MKQVQIRKAVACALLVGIATLLLSAKAYGISRLTSSDPLPVYLAGNPLGAYTYWENCEPEYNARFGVSFYRQSACKGRGDPFYSGTCDSTAACTNCNSICDKDIPLGDIHGRWNMPGLFYPEPLNVPKMDYNTNIHDLLINNLPIDITNTTTSACVESFSNPQNSDPNKLFGFFSVPIEYRKHGIRFEADIDAFCNLGVRLQTGVASIRQVAQFDDQTCSATYTTCEECTDTFSCDCKKVMINEVMKQREQVAKILGLDIDNYCETQMEDVVLSLYWSRCYEYNADTENPCWTHYTFAPYFVGSVSMPFAKSRPVDKLFSLPFGNDRHTGYGFTGGFNINFIETIQVGLEAGFTRFSKEAYCNYPVPTNDLQAGIFPRKANVCIEPGTNWSFAATMGAYHFLDCLSSYIQFQMVRHCCDTIKVLDTIKLTQAQLDTIPATTDVFPVSNVKVEKMENESKWNSSFVNVSFTYDISSNMELGFFWQAPVRQEFAYRPTTVMATLAFNF